MVGFSKSMIKGGINETIEYTCEEFKVKNDDDEFEPVVFNLRPLTDGEVTKVQERIQEGSMANVENDPGTNQVKSMNITLSPGEAIANRREAMYLAISKSIVPDNKNDKLKKEDIKKFPRKSVEPLFDKIMEISQVSKEDLEDLEDFREEE